MAIEIFLNTKYKDIQSASANTRFQIPESQEGRTRFQSVTDPSEPQ